jgi:hypothetical protein
MRVIWKWVVHGDSARLSVPRGTRFVAAGVDADGNVAIWGDCDPDLEMVKREVYLIDTGVRVPVEAVHVGSFLSPSGVFVWHIYAEPEVDR